MDPQQWEILQKMLAAKQAAQMRDPSLRRNAAPGQGSMNNAGPAIPGLMGSQSGPDPNPFSQVPGGGSTANALPLANPLADERARLQKLSDDALVNALLGYGIAGGSLAAGPNPLTLLGALGGGAYGIINNQISRNAGANARRLGYQGN
jgi:hypothetical protein